LADNVSIYAVAISLPGFVAPELRETFEKHLPDFYSISHSVDPMVRFLRSPSVNKLIGKEIYLRMTADCSEIASHSSCQYMACLLDTQLGCPRKKNYQNDQVILIFHLVSPSSEQNRWTPYKQQRIIDEQIEQQPETNDQTRHFKFIN